MTKQEYIDGIRHIAFGDLGEHFHTDIDFKTDSLYSESDLDCEEIEANRSKGNIIKFDKLFAVWVNGVVWSWNVQNDDKISNDDIVPDFNKVWNDSCLYAIDGNMKFYGEFPRL